MWLVLSLSAFLLPILKGLLRSRKRKCSRLIDMLEEDDDVQAVYH